MATHVFTTAQMRKFINAIGGVPKSEVTGGQFTTQKLRTLAESIGGLDDWPKFTDDPRVNFAVDCVVLDDDDEPVYDDLYVDEVEALRADGEFD